MVGKSTAMPWRVPLGRKLITQCSSRNTRMSGKGMPDTALPNASLAGPWLKSEVQTGSISTRHSLNAKPFDADGNAPFYPSDKCLLKEARESRIRDCYSLLPLQLHPQAYDNQDNTGCHVGCCEPRMDDG